MPNEKSLRDYRVIGAAGEHYVLRQLLRHGFIAAPAPEGVAKMDIIASDRNGVHLFSIQVKTRNERGTDGDWHIKRKHETALPDFFTASLRRLLPNYATATMLRPEISSADRTWLHAHGSGWLSLYNQAWAQLGPSLSQHT